MNATSKLPLYILTVSLLVLGCSAKQDDQTVETQVPETAPPDTLRYGGEEHLKNIRVYRRDSRVGEHIWRVYRDATYALDVPREEVAEPLTCPLP